MKPICVPCKRFFRPKRNGFHFIEGMPTENGAKPGLEQPEKWTPYKHWVGDLYECKGCGAQVIVGVPLNPIGEHYQEKFADGVLAYGAGQLQVNDC